jgi:hypothetical protein
MPDRSNGAGATGVECSKEYWADEGVRIMKRALFALLIAGATPVPVFAQSTPAPRNTVNDFWPSGQNGEGRFRIFFSPHARADTYLLDTQTGKVWQLTQFTGLNGEPTAWVPMSRLENSEDQAAFVRAHGGKRSPEIPK